MNTQLYNSINTLDREINGLESRIHGLDSKINSKQKEATRALEKAQREKNLNSVINLQKQYQRLNDEASRLEKDKIGLSKILNEKQKRKAEYRVRISKEEEKDHEKLRKDLKEQLNLQKNIRNAVLKQNLPPWSTQSSPTRIMNETYDLFISHASEDKKDFVEPLAAELIANGFKVWLDKSVLKLGDSLRRSIDNGLINSRYGIVILSPAFFAKEWPQYELDGLVSREVNGQKVILPIWHKVSKDDVMHYSPSLVGKLGIRTSDYTIQEIVHEIASVFSNK